MAVLLLCFVLMLILSSCCCDTCTIVSDDFATDTSANYSQRSGTWTWGSGTVSTTSASALLRHETAVTAGLTGVYSSVKITCATTSDLGRLVISYTDDSNYWFAEVQPGTNHGWLKLYQRSGGTDTLKGSTKVSGLQANEQITLTLCYASGKVRAYIASATAGVEVAATITIASTKCGLGTGAGSSSVTFDDFSFAKHDVDNTACEACLTSCTIFSDDYATDELSQFYNQRTGTFTVTGGTVTTTSTPGLLRCEALGTFGHGRVSVRGKSSTGGGSTIRVVGSYTDDNNYLFAEITFSGVTGALRLWKKVAGADTQLGTTQTFTFATNTFYQLRVCWDGTTAVAVGGDQVISGAYTGTGNQGGLGANPTSGGTATFDDFEFVVYVDDNADCEECTEDDTSACNLCITGVGPKFLSLTVSGVMAAADNDCLTDGGSFLECDNATLANATWIVPRATITDVLSDISCAGTPDIDPTAEVCTWQKSFGGSCTGWPGSTPLAICKHHYVPSCGTKWTLWLARDADDKWAVIVKMTSALTGGDPSDPSADPLGLLNVYWLEYLPDGADPIDCPEVLNDLELQYFGECAPCNPDQSVIDATGSTIMVRVL